MGGFYLQRKYPNTSRKLTKFFLGCLIIYLPIYFLYIAPPRQAIQANSLQSIIGSVNSIAISSDKQKFTTLTLVEYPGKQFSFEAISNTSSDVMTIQRGDAVKLLALKAAINSNLNPIPSYELESNGTLFFSMEEYNSTITGNKTLTIIFLVVALIILILYFFLKHTGLAAWLNRQLSLGDRNFQPNNPNFNEFLDR